MMQTYVWRMSFGCTGHKMWGPTAARHGLFLVEAARHLTSGSAVGIDVWSQKDQWHDAPAAAITNARRAGVASRVHVHDADARHLPFPDATFDVVTSSLVIHNIPGREQRDRVLREVVRVLKPGGRVLMSTWLTPRTTPASFGPQAWETSIARYPCRSSS
jgi:ubiquinone/menaquinone biosynthesis C-methylase UbiE